MSEVDRLEAIAQALEAKAEITPGTSEKRDATKEAKLRRIGIAIAALDFSSSDALEEAPIDGLQYLRQSAEWEAIAAYLTDAPVDGNEYVRKDGGWEIASVAAGGFSDVNHIQFKLSPTGTPEEGRLSWDEVDGTLEVGMPGGNVTQQIGQEFLVRVRNVTGSTIPNGTVVYAAGAQGAFITIAKAGAAEADPAHHPMGITTEEIGNNSNGYVTTFGFVRGLDTSVWSEGTYLYLSNTLGALTSTPPSAPSPTVLIAVVTKQHATEGSIYFRWGVPLSVSDLSDVDGTTPSAVNNVLIWQNSTGVWDPGALSVTQLSDVSTNAPTTQQVLAYNATNAEYEPTTAGGGGGGVEVEVFEVGGSATWTKPTGAVKVRAFIIGGGGGGGSGAFYSSDTGGGGGQGGFIRDATYDAADLSATEPIVVGAGGAGGAPRTSAGGNHGSDGSDSSFAGLVAAGGDAGVGGNTSLASGGSYKIGYPQALSNWNPQIAGVYIMGGMGGNGDDLDNNATTGKGAKGVTGGGGGGGGRNSSTGANQGNTGGDNYQTMQKNTQNATGNRQGDGGAGGASPGLGAPGNDGSVGPDTELLLGGGQGGGGGSASVYTVSGATCIGGEGGNGGHPGGGGGGGGCAFNTTANLGAGSQGGGGGDGGDGRVIVITYT
jgi:hypothetical protein